MADPLSYNQLLEKGKEIEELLHSQVDKEEKEELDHSQDEKLFDQDVNEDEESFEIPAFLRKQKF